MSNRFIVFYKLSYYYCLNGVYKKSKAISLRNIYYKEYPYSLINNTNFTFEVKKKNNRYID